MAIAAPEITCKLVKFEVAIGLPGQIAILGMRTAQLFFSHTGFHVSAAESAAAGTND